MTKLIEQQKQHQYSEMKQLNRLHPEIPGLLALIAASTQSFKSVPEGPLGLLLTFDKSKAHLAEAAERALSGQKGLCSFIVTNQDDERTLRELMRRVDRSTRPARPTVLQLNHRCIVHVRAAEPRFSVLNRVETRHPLLLDVITTRSDAAFNLLVDHFKGAITLLFDVKMRS